jgi:hypothetical protein
MIVKNEWGPLTFHIVPPANTKRLMYVLTGTDNFLKPDGGF